MHNILLHTSRFQAKYVSHERASYLINQLHKIIMWQDYSTEYSLSSFHEITECVSLQY